MSGDWLMRKSDYFALCSLIGHYECRVGSAETQIGSLTQRVYDLENPSHAPKSQRPITAPPPPPPPVEAPPVDIFREGEIVPKKSIEKNELERAHTVNREIMTRLKQISDVPGDHIHCDQVLSRIRLLIEEYGILSDV